MAITSSISQKELKRLAGLAYEGETLKVMLCEIGNSNYTAESTVADWQSIEKSGNGYTRYSEVISTGAYDAVDSRYEMPAIDAAFTAPGTGYTYDRSITYIDGETYIHSMIQESPNITLSPDQTQTYRIQLITND